MLSFNALMAIIIKLANEYFFLSVSAMSPRPSQVYSKSAGVEAKLLDSRKKGKKKVK